MSDLTDLTGMIDRVRFRGSININQQHAAIDYLYLIYSMHVVRTRRVHNSEHLAAASRGRRPLFQSPVAVHRTAATDRHVADRVAVEQGIRPVRMAVVLVATDTGVPV